MCDCVRVCSRCGCEVVFDDDLVTNGYEEDIYNYDCACLVCDEDLDLWETELVQKDEVKIRITENDKNYYRKHDYLSTEMLYRNNLITEEELKWFDLQDKYPNKTVDELKIMLN